MKRRIEETQKSGDSGGGYSHPPSPLSPPPRLPTRPLTTVGQATYASALKPSTELRTVQGFSTTFTTAMPAVTPAIKSAANAGLQGGAQTLSTIHTLQAQALPPRHKVHTGGMTPPTAVAVAAAVSAQQQQIQRLKVEDALSYLDMVKYKFGDQPQVYNDFLDIMKEFKSQSIDTPGVIERVSNLFNGHPELIVGFNTFLPPGYKIEVKTNDQGYSFQVQVSMPSPSAATTTLAPAPATVHHPPPLPQPTHNLITTTVVTKPVILATTPLVQPAAAPVPPVVVVPAAPAAAPPAPPPTPPPPAPAPPAQPHFPTISQVQHQAVSQALSHADGGPPPTPQSQPVEFNHAINYVNKIKNRFQGQPDKYKRFLEILHTYQKEQRTLKEGGAVAGTAAGAAGNAAGSKQLTEAEVYSQVAKLFEHQEDLLAEFGQFLPDATNHQTQLARRCEEPPAVRKTPVNVKVPAFNSTVTAPAPAAPSPCPSPAPPAAVGAKSAAVLTTAPPVSVASDTQCQGPAPVLKRSPSLPSGHSAPAAIPAGPSVPLPAPKKQKISLSYRDVSLSEAAKHGTLADFAFFDKVRKALRHQEIYDSFLRCMNLYNSDVISRSELLQMVTPFLTRFPELLRWFKEYIGHADGPPVHVPGMGSPPRVAAICAADPAVNNALGRPDRPVGEQGEVDFATCKRLGASYCALPRNHQQEKCSGRTPLCREVLNDTWVSFPTWSEESTFVTSRKTQYEEYIYRCEDERFELDAVLEVNASTIRALEGVHKKLCRMSSEEVAKFHLDDCLGGTSPTIHIKAVNRVYGEKGPEIIEGLKKNPVAALPIVLRRLKAKDEEWRDAQKGFNKIWREQNEKYYLKSLDHQGINFKQNDLKSLRSKALFNEIETAFDERHEQAEAGDSNAVQGPHMILPYKSRAVLDDAINLLIHHVKRQTGIQKDDKARIKKLLRCDVPDLFHHPRQELSEDEREPDDEKKGLHDGHSYDGVNHKLDQDVKRESDDSNEAQIPSHVMGTAVDEEYTLFFGNGNWYMFLRMHQILCERLTHIYEQANAIVREESRQRLTRSESVAMSLRLKPRCEELVDLEVEDYYPAFLEMVKNVLDGNMDSNTFEDTLREMFGIQAYLAFTLDKVVIYAVRQLQHLVADDSCVECLDMLSVARNHRGAGGACMTATQRVNAEAAYQRKAELALADENCFKFIIYKVDCRLSIELLDNEGDDNDTHSRETDKWVRYPGKFTKANNNKDDDCDDDDMDDCRLWGKAIFLPRNVRLWHRKMQGKNKDLKMICNDESMCKFALNSYKMVFVMDRESYLYKKNALKRAKSSHQRLSDEMGRKFARWHDDWASRNISPRQFEYANDWLTGDLPDYGPYRTLVVTENLIDRPPYRRITRFQVVPDPK